MKLLITVTILLNTLNINFNFCEYQQLFARLDNLSEVAPPELFLRAGEAHKIAGKAFSDVEQADHLLSSLGYGWDDSSQTERSAHLGKTAVINVAAAYFSFFDHSTGTDLWPEFLHLLDQLDDLQIHVRREPNFSEHYKNATIFILGTHEQDLVVGTYHLSWT